MAPRKIVLVGPESTGKTYLVTKLAKHFQVPFVPEYARQYLTSGNTIITPQDLSALAEKQFTAEQQALKNCHAPWIFCDTDFHNIVVWSQQVFGIVDPHLQRREDEQHYDLYLLLSPDLPWVPDGLRENPHLREKLYQIYHTRLLEKNRLFVAISGKNNRFEACLEALRKLLNTANN
jgi:NadR type nicotinamide-nucleotide adenylyltransferase